MNILEFFKSKFNFKKRLPAGEEDYTKLIDKMMNNKDAIMQFIEYKTFREENPKTKSKKIQIEGPYTNIQLEQLFTNPELQEAIMYAIGNFDNKQKAENYIDNYNAILDKHEFYGFVKRMDKEESYKRVNAIYEIYNPDSNNGKRDIIKYTEALREYSEESKNANMDIRVKCIALLKDLKDIVVNGEIKKTEVDIGLIKKLKEEIGSFDMFEDLRSGGESVNIAMARIEKIEEVEMNKAKEEEERYLALRKKEALGELTDEEKKFVREYMEKLEIYVKAFEEDMKKDKYEKKDGGKPLVDIADLIM